MCFTFLCGCSKEKDITVINGGFVCRAHIFLNEKEFFADMKTEENGDCVFLLTEPETVCGYKVTVTENGGQSEFNNITSETIPEVFLNIYSLLKNSDTADKVYSQDNEYYTVGEEGCLYLTDSGIPMRMEFDSKNYVEFLSFSLENVG